jgi:hypothetical protein
MANKLEFFTNGVGRFVNGSLTEKRTKDNDGRPLAEDKQRFEFGIAFPKDDPDFQRILGELYGFLSSEYANKPQLMNMVNTWWQTQSGYSMKIADGDKPNARGGVNENTKGHYVVYFASNYPPQCCDPVNQQIDPAAIKRGYYVQVAGNVAPNGLENHQAGIYVNPSVIRLVAEGEEIRGGVDAATAFGGTTAANIQMPAGARPLGTAMTQSPAAPGVGMPAPAAAPTTAPVPGPTAPAGMPGQVGGPAPAQPQTAYPSNPPNQQFLTGPGGAMPGMPGTQ